MPLPPDVLDAIVSELQINIPLHDEPERKQSVRTFTDFTALIDKQISFWQQNNVGRMLAHFEAIAEILRRAKRGGIATDDVRSLIQEAVNKASQKTQANLYAETARANFLAGLMATQQQAAVGAASIFDGTFNTGILTNRYALEGALAAIAFDRPDLFGLVPAAHLKAFDQQRNEISTFRTGIETDYLTTKQAAEQWKESIRASTDEIVDRAKEDLAGTEKKWASFSDQSNVTFEDSRKKWAEEIDALKKTYQEHLRLKEPAGYWGELETKYLRQGRIWILVSALAATALAISAVCIAYRPPAIFTNPTETFGGIKGALLIAGGFSLALYVTNLFVKIATSAYHLARDARERLQLTHVFLALIKDAAIEPSDRAIILTALFRRADTGLLKSDGGPTVPTPLGALFEVHKDK